MCRYMVEGAPCGKRNAGFQAIFRDELAHAVLQPLTEICHANARFCDGPNVLADLQRLVASGLFFI